MQINGFSQSSHFCFVVKACIISPVKLQTFFFQPEPNDLRMNQGPLITDGRNSCKLTGPTVGLYKFFVRVENSGQNF